MSAPRTGLSRGSTKQDRSHVRHMGNGSVNPEPALRVSACFEVVSWHVRSMQSTLSANPCPETWHSRQWQWLESAAYSIDRKRPQPKDRGRSNLTNLLRRLMPTNHPGEVEHAAFFNQHLGPRFQSAGLRVQFHYNQAAGIHFKVEPPAEYADAILRGLRHGLDRHFPSFSIDRKYLD